MARNIEIKARIESAAACAERIAALALADQGPIDIVQDDTFFGCDAGRLKLRVFADGTGELIFYRRANSKGPKESFYVRAPASAPDALRDCLSAAHGQVGRVVKRRRLYLAGRTRIHLDDVERLGQFLELEVVLADGEDADVGMREARDLMGKLGILPQQLTAEAYVDLLAPGRS
ncbi:MAG: class IV adenylate cyclase [Steroidobacteraceae bacterium]|jgi:predicted adenylyl cyclase CyaB